jgi:HK97 family phage prohead protease
MESLFTAAKSVPVMVEKRSDGRHVIVGYGAVFYNPDDPGTEYEAWKGIAERVARTAFDRALKDKDDVRGLFNHDPNFVLGRTTAGTMRLSVDKRGLRYEIDVADTQAGRDVVTSIGRGDLDGSSFSFNVDDQGWDESNAKRPVRVIKSVRLFDVGPVTFPAYEATTTGLRANSREEADVRKSLEEWRIGTLFARNELKRIENERKR